MLSDSRKANIGFWLTIITGIFGFYTYLESRQLARLTYTIVQETVYRPSKALGTALSIPGRPEPITGRVTQSVVTVWNGGNVPFKGEDTRTKLTLSGDSSVTIAAQKVALTKTLPGSTGFNVTGDDKALVIDWRIFDPREGLQIVILSTGNAESLDLKGRFLPNQEIIRGPIKSIVSSSATMVVFMGALAVLFLFLGLIVPAIGRLTSSIVLRFAMSAAVIVVLCFGGLVVSFRVLYYARAFVGDVSPIDPYRQYIDVDPRLDYRAVPM